MPFEMWIDNVCGHCEQTCGSIEDEDDLPYRLRCPTCYRDGCEMCMPLGRGCECPDCEETKLKVD